MYLLCHPLGPLPWSLENVDGTIKKTNKAALSLSLKKKVTAAENMPQQSAIIIDAMGIIQKLHGENRSFNELAAHILAAMLHAGKDCMRIDIVFDVYRQYSIKSAERANRGSQAGVVFNDIRPGHTIRN